MIKADTFINAVHIQITLSETVNGQNVTGHKDPMNISGKFGSILFSGFREEDLNVKS
jgi:hypothetical protein